MAEQEYAQFTVYAAEAAIPRYQRAWVWGTAALAVLLCGAIAGWLLSGAMPPRWGIGTQPTGGIADGAALLAQQEAINAQLRERIAELEQVLSGDVCTPAALKALTLDLHRP
ncbi:MAG TPA: hypothetical protein P5102_01865 [Candidatus Competibacteraceae bacterium]|nr:hypothetical protein [Candidatus Competibacteraceae bacterium]HRZ04892.1 hypothetical protein [Candidatus Competibacteraceae bacterium]HSA46784.1 hypothetical protein [Candidatus Competibacteraceae bacterium]